MSSRAAQTLKRTVSTFDKSLKRMLDDIALERVTTAEGIKIIREATSLLSTAPRVKAKSSKGMCKPCKERACQCGPACNKPSTCTCTCPKRAGSKRYKIGDGVYSGS